MKIDFVSLNWRKDFTRNLLPENCYRKVLPVRLFYNKIKLYSFMKCISSNIFHDFSIFCTPLGGQFFVHKNPVTINVTIVSINVTICAHALVPTSLETFKYVINS